ncbi:MAG TPA: hypothetical protein VFK30_09555, partial [Anaerolineae bacterium]|nr:hypothetical protein [Anaerolineae bacterium]
LQVSTRAWRITLLILLFATTIPIVIAIAIATQATATVLWHNFDDRWSINVGSIVGDEWQVPIISNSVGLATHQIEAADFSFQARMLSQDPNIATGLVINFQDQLNFTAFLISGDGYMSLREMRSGQWIDRVPWQTWPHVKRDGQANILRVECRSDQCAFFVNDELTLPENNLSAGKSMLVPLPGVAQIGLIAYSLTPPVSTASITFDQILATVPTVPR